jgi:hypothetical protein
MSFLKSRDYAPIALFVYNRPRHTKKVLDSLSKCEESKDSILFVFSDGPKPNEVNENKFKINEVRNIVLKESRFKQIFLITSDINKGLSNSIIDGVSQILLKYSRIIVLEDDLVVSSTFLQYMNDGLCVYENKKIIASICSFWHPQISAGFDAPYFFLSGGDCWGWATWQDRWSLFDSDALAIKKKLIENNLLQKFEFGGMLELLDLQIQNKVSSWFIRWHGSLILHNKLSVFPRQSFVRNIGLDGSGTHGDKFIIDIPSLNQYEMNLDLFDINYDLIESQERVIKAQFLTLKRIVPKPHLFKRYLTRVMRLFCLNIK